MAISHIKSNTIADFTGTVTVFNSVGSTQTANATDLVRPIDWNSVHNFFQTISGNTAGTSSMSGTNLVWAGGNNITLSNNTAAGAATISIHGVAAQSVVPGIQSIQVSNTTYTTGNVIFSNANGLSFGSSAGGAVTASYTVPSTAGLISNINVSAGTTSTNASAFTFSNSNGLAFGLGTGANVGVVTGSYTVPSTAGLISAIGVTGSNGNFTTTGISFSNANGVSFGTSAGSAVTASYTVPTVTQYFSNTATTFNGANISGSITNNTAGLQLSLSVAAPGGGAQTAISGIANSETTYTSGSVTFRDLNGISWQSTTGQQFQITHGLQFTSNTSNITSNALHTSASRVINIVAATNNTGGGTASLSSNVSFSAANGLTFYTSAGNAIVGSHNALTSQSNQNVTAGNGGFAFQTLSFSNANNFSFGTSAGSAITGSFSQSVQPVNASASNGSFNFSTLAFSNANNVTFGTSAGSIITASVAAPGAAAENNWFALLGANTAGNTTASGSTIGLSGLGLTLSGTNGSVIVVSGGAGGAAQTIGGYEVFPLGNNSTFSTMGQNSIYLQKFIPTANVSFNNLERRMSGSSASSSIAVNVNHTFDYGVYSRGSGASTSLYSLAGSSQLIIQASYSSNLSAGYTISQGAASRTSSSAGTVVLGEMTGFKHLYFPFTSTITAGGEWAVAFRMSSATTGNTGALRIALKELSNFNNLTIGKVYATTVLATNASFVGDFAQAVYSATSSNLPNTIGISGFTNAISQMRQYIQLEV